MAFVDGIQGIEKFVIDSFVASARAGAVCPPSVLGIDIGGTANVAANLAKEAACCVQSAQDIRIRCLQK